MCFEIFRKVNYKKITPIGYEKIERYVRIY